LNVQTSAYSGTYGKCFASGDWPILEQILDSPIRREPQVNQQNHPIVASKKGRQSDEIQSRAPFMLKLDRIIYHDQASA
jgi:hypothetical protein